MRLILNIAVTLMLLGQTHCSSDDVFVGSDGIEKKPESKLAPNQDTTPKKRRLFQSLYHFTVKMKKLGKKICEGSAELIAYTDFSTEMRGDIPCDGSRRLNLQDMMGTTAGELTLKEAKMYPFYDKVSRIGNNAVTQYDPPFPFILGPVVQNVKDYEGFAFSENSRVQHRTRKGQTENGAGIVSVKVLEAGIPFRPEGYTEEFKNVMHWERTTSGFDTISERGGAFLYEKFEYWWSVRPIAIPMIRIEGPLKQFIGIEDIATAIGSAIGVTLVVEMNLVEHTQF